MPIRHVSLAALLLLFGCALGCLHIPGSEADLTRWERDAAISEKGRAYAHYLTSIILRGRGDRDGALAQMEDVAGLDPGAPTPTLNLIRGYIENQQFEDALRMAGRAIEQDPTRANLWIIQGEIQYNLDRYEEATASFKRAIELNPANLMGYTALVEVQENTNDLVAAVRIYERLLEMEPESAAIHYQLGLTLVRINDAEAARKHLKQALALNPRLVRALYMLGVLALEAGDHAESRDFLNQYLERRPGDMDAMESLVGAFTQLEDFDEAVSLLQRMAVEGELHTGQHLAAMYVLLRAGRPELASGMAPPVGAPYLGALFTAFSRQQQGQPHEKLLANLDQTDGDLDAECNEYINQLLYLMGEGPAGDWLLDKLSTARQAQDGKALSIIQARTLMSLGRHAEALPLLNPLSEKHPEDKFLHYYLAVCHEELGHVAQTEHHLKAYLDIHPDDPDVLNFLGYLYAEENMKLDEAEALIQRALEFEPESPFYLDSLGWVYYRMGKAKQAIDLILRAIHLMESDDAILRDHLGDAYLLDGQVEQAIESWERAHRLDPELEGVREKLEQHGPHAPGDGQKT